MHQRTASFPGYARRVSARPRVGAGQRLEFALACIAVLLGPMNILRPEAIYFTLGDLFASLCFVTMAANRSINLRVFGPGTAFWVFGLVLMCATIFASSLYAGVVDRGLILTAQYLFAYLIMPIILLNRPREATEFLMKVFLASIVVTAAFGVYVVDIVGQTNTEFVSGAGRLLGLVERANTGGALFALSIPIAMGMGGARIINPLVAAAVVGLAAYGLMLSASNSALYTTIIGIGIYFVVTADIKRFALGGVFLVLVIVALQFSETQQWLPGVFQKRVLLGLQTGDLDAAGSYTDRMALIREAVELTRSTMFLGFGADQHRVVSQYLAPVHSLYLLLWTEGGILAMIGFIAMLCGGAIVLASGWRSGCNKSVVAGGVATLSMFSLIVIAMPHTYGRFMVIPIILAIAPALLHLNEGARRIRR